MLLTSQIKKQAELEEDLKTSTDQLPKEAELKVEELKVEEPANQPL